MRATTKFLQDAFKIRPEEVRRTSLAFIYLFHAIAAFIAARITRTTLFLEIENYKDQLPLTYLGIAVTVSAVMYGYARVERTLRRDHTNMITLTVLIAGTLGFWVLLQLAHGWGTEALHRVYWAFFIWVEVFGTFLIVQFWSITNEVFHSRQAKRLFAFIGGGGVLANVAVGFGIRGLVSSIGTDNLLLVISAALAITLWCVWQLGKAAGNDLTAAKERAPSKKGGASQSAANTRVFATRHVQLIALVVILTYAVSTVVDYQFNVIIGDTVIGKDARSAYYATFFGITGIIGGIIQFTLTSRILERFGVLFALLMLPIAMFAGSIAVGFASVAMLLPLVSFTKGSENCLRYTVNDSTLQLLYLPVPSHIRGRAKTFIDGILKPISIGGTGLLLALLVGNLQDVLGIDLGFRLSIGSASWLAVIGLIAWSISLLALRREYLASLVNTLHRRRLNFEDAGFQINDDGTIKTLELALSQGNMGEILHALELLPHVADKARGVLSKKVTRLLEHEAGEVRVAGLKYLTAAGDNYSELIAPLLDDASHTVRAVAAGAYCASLREKSIDGVTPLLQDWDQHVQAAAVAGLIRHGGLDGVLACANVLKNWLESPLAADRRQAAWVLGEIGLQNFYQPLVPLLNDPEEYVRLAAITAAGKLNNPELIEPLVSQLERPRLRGAASIALAAYGSDIEDIIGMVLTDVHRPTAVRSQACKILARLGDSHAASILMLQIDAESPQIRHTAVRAIASIAARLPGLGLNAKAIDDSIRAEARHWYETLALSLDLEFSEKSVLLRDALDNRLRSTIAHVLTLLSLKYPAKTIDLVSRNLRSQQKSTIGNAVEVLDNLLNKDEKSFIIPIIDDNTPEIALQAGVEIFDVQRMNRQERLRSLLGGADSWMRNAAAFEVANAQLKSLDGDVANLLQSEDAISRETAVHVLWQLGTISKHQGRVAQLKDDAVPTVKSYSTFVLAQASA